MGWVRSESLLVRFTSPRKLTGVIAKMDGVLGFSEHLKYFLSIKDPQVLPNGLLQSPGVTSGFSTAVSTAVEELLVYRPILLSTEMLCLSTQNCFKNWINVHGRVN